MSALQTLPPDQRAVLQLILKQGRGYADLSGILRIDEAAVRARAVAGLEALGSGGEALSPRRRAQLTDYLLGQQSGEEQDATRVYLGDSAAARRWATSLRDQLAPLSRAELPEVPPVSANGHGPEATANATALDAADEPAEEPPADERPAAPAPRRGRVPEPALSPAAPDRDGAPRRSSKLGGILLIAGVAALIAVIAIVLIGGGDDDPASSPAARTQAQTTGQTTAGGGADTPQVLAQVNLNPVAGGEAAGIGWVQRVDGRPMIVVQVQRIAPNGEQDVYAAWLRADDGRTRFLGFVPSQVGRQRSFTVSALLPDNAERFDEVLVTRESITTARTPSSPRDIVLSGALRLRG
jgi:hypothetical protein